jgi:CRP/FNR family transcriptional regulator, dissimilatory nitrate respiration regulator
MQHVTDHYPVSEAHSAAKKRGSPVRGASTPGPGMSEVRAAWQDLLGPAALAPHLAEKLLMLSSVRKAGAGQQVLSSQAVAQSLIVLVQGDVGLGLWAPPAAFRIERSLHGPAWLDATSAWLNCAPRLDGVASGAALLVHVSRSAYQTLMEQYPGLARLTIISLARQAHAAAGVLHDLMQKDAQTRLAGWLLQRCPVPAQSLLTPQIQLRERKRDIASQLAVTPETLSRLLKQFSDEGLLEVHGYAVTVRDLAGLQARASHGVA